jgi:hypothetical protein
MKALLALAFVAASVAGSAEAAVTFDFTGTPSFGLSVRHFVDGRDDVTQGDASQPVGGSFTIDTAAAGPNTADAPAVSYQPGNTPFITARFSGPAVAGIGPLLYDRGVATHYVDADGFDTAIISYSFEDIDSTGRFTRSTYELSGFGVTTTVLDGILLPDFSKATDVTFSLTSQFGTDDDYYEYFAAGTADIADVAAVPEPATWGMMLLGFGLVGTAARRRRTALAA